MSEIWTVQILSFLNQIYFVKENTNDSITQGKLFLSASLKKKKSSFIKVSFIV